MKTGAWILVVAIVALVSILASILAMRAIAPGCASCRACPLQFGGYGFVSNGFDDPLLPQLAARLVSEHGITDVQFYDWFPNYSGRFQGFPANTAYKTPTAAPYWWTGPQWKDPWFRDRVISADILRLAVKAVQDAGGRAWAYVQCQGSEYETLAGEGHACYGPANVKPYSSGALPKDHGYMKYPVFVTTGDAIQTVQQTGNTPPLYSRKCQPPSPASSDRTIPARTLPAYYANAAMARYQCNAWVDVVKSVGFCGIHWDTMVSSEGQDDALGAKAFVEAAGGILKGEGLLQTFNDINGGYGVSAAQDFFKSKTPLLGELLFPYSEVWGSAQEDAYVKTHSDFAVIASYPGSNSFGCPADGEGTDEHIVCCRGPTETSSCFDMNSLALARCQRYKLNGLRYCLLGCGAIGDAKGATIGVLVNEYFPTVAVPSGELLACLRRA